MMDEVVKVALDTLKKMVTEGSSEGFKLEAAREILKYAVAIGER